MTSFVPHSASGTPLLGELMRSTRIIALVGALGFGVPAISYGQTLDSLPLTYKYPGIGDVTWTPVKGLKTRIAVPHFSSGPRVVCVETAYRCDIEVNLRTVRYFSRTEGELLAEIREQFPEMGITLPPNAQLRQRIEPELLALTYNDTTGTGRFRYTAVALVIRGPAVFQITAEANDTTAVANVLALAKRTRLIDEHAMMSYRLGQMVDACAERVPATRAVNERARAASMFDDTVLVNWLRVSDSTATLATVLSSRRGQLPQFVTALDELEALTREVFCSSLARVIATAERDLRSRPR